MVLEKRLKIFSAQYNEVVRGTKSNLYKLVSRLLIFLFIFYAKKDFDFSFLIYN